MRRIILVLSLLLAVFTFINALSSAKDAQVLDQGVVSQTKQ